MAKSRKAEILEQSRLFDGFFKIDQVMVRHERQDGTMSGAERRLVFERGDSVAVVLHNLDADAVVLVEQFKVPTLIGGRRADPTATNGWITETIAGMIDENETPEQAAIRETEEETGYRVGNLKLIAAFFSSPGGTSERIFLYFAQARDKDRRCEGGGINNEDVRVLHIPLAALFEALGKGSIEDAKLALGAYWLKDYLNAQKS